MVVEADAPVGGKMLTLGLPVLLSGTNQIAASAPPRVGEHTLEILCELGFADDEINELLDSGVINQVTDKTS